MTSIATINIEPKSSTVMRYERRENSAKGIKKRAATATCNIKIC